MKLYEVNYRGLWLGGKAIVFADSEQSAIEKVKNHHTTNNFEDVEVHEIIAQDVVFNDNGGY